VADLCASWFDGGAMPLFGEPCGEPSVCVIRAGCVHEHLLEWRACSGCAVDEQKAAGIIWCKRCLMTGPVPHDCLPLVVIAWDEGYREPEATTMVQPGGPGFQSVEPFGRGEIIKTAPDEDLYISWSHITGEPKWIGSRAHALAAGCIEERLQRADRNGSSFLRFPPGKGWNAAGLIAEQRGHLARGRLADYVNYFIDDRLTDAYGLLEPLDWGEACNG
jgi:hypothetical protein